MNIRLLMLVHMHMHMSELTLGFDVNKLRGTIRIPRLTCKSNKLLYLHKYANNEYAEYQDAETTETDAHNRVLGFTPYIGVPS